MHTKTTLKRDLAKMNVDPRGTLLVHSSYKSIGDVEGGPDAVLDALSEYMQDGLLVLPTHTWSYIGPERPQFRVEDSPSNVGMLTERFRRRPGVIRSLHPTHSVAALGRDAETFVEGHERSDTPCGPLTPYRKLLDRKGTIALVGVDLRKNTFIHGVEEWADIPGRLTDEHLPLTAVRRDGTEISVPSRKHCGEIWSDYFWKVNDLLIRHQAMFTGVFGNAETRICDTQRMTDLLLRLLRADPGLFSDNDPVDLGLEQALAGS